MNLAYRRGLPALFAAALAAGVVGAGTPALAAGTAPTGTFTLDTTTLWTGQQVKLTQTALADDDTLPEAISRVITWGDGTSTTAAAGEDSWTHTYAAAGSFPVSVALNDGTVAGTGTIASPNVAVTTAPGTLAWQKSTVYTAPDPDGGSYLTEAIFTPSKLPASADQAWTTWGDGEFTLLAEGAESTTVPHYFGKGTWRPKVQLENEHGKATARDANPLTVAYDVTAPTSALTYPANPNRSSSWKAIRGTGRDSQSGPDVAQVAAFKYNASSDYYFNFYTKKWVRITNPDADLPDEAYGLSTVNSAGVWSVPISGLSKGFKLEAWYWVFDKVGNPSKGKWATVTMTS
ncbi:hypothetical protein [Actinoplanes sp. URMC 104]|uniref:hypothetical protein n=1 Tax=Actinoplanes sp. URMC 104 TaxID=3423409 RepID=UPI003F19F0EA